MVRADRRLHWLGLFPVLFLSGAGRAVTPPVIDCPWYSPTKVDDFSVRGFYVASYPGTSLGAVTLILSPSAAGTYSLSLTARQGNFGGTLLGTVTVPVTFATTAPVPVAFDFGNVAVTQGATVAFQGSVVSGPSAVSMEVETSNSCLVFETDGTNPPLGTFRRQGIAVTITGGLPATFAHTVTVPAVASIHGNNGAFFHTDVWAYSFDANVLDVTATYYCYLQFSSCGSGTQTFSINPGTGQTFSDVAGTAFGAPETAGALVFRYFSTSSNNTLRVLTRTYTPSLPSPTNGASLLGVTPTSNSGKWTFVGLGNNGGDRSAGFRTNAGVFNSYAVAATVTFNLSTKGGTPLGSVTQTWAPHEARQINDIFGTVGAGGTVTTDAVLTVVSDIPIYAYVTVIDNQTGDSVIQ
jgi:hypothetical protein